MWFKVLNPSMISIQWFKKLSFISRLFQFEKYEFKNNFCASGLGYQRSKSQSNPAYSWKNED
jgi:hypothetical protein